MATRVQDAYLEAKVLSADPIELVRLLYAAAIESVDAARRHLAAKDIRARSDAIGKAVEILSELNASLCPERAPQVSQRLAGLYDYIQRRLLAANFDQSDEPLAEALRLLNTLADAWRALPLPSVERASPETRVIPSAAYSRVSPLEAGPAVHGWSF